MDPWTCILIITSSGGIGGLINAIMSENGFPLPKKINNIWNPGFLGNVLIGAVSAFLSWTLYGSGASIELFSTSNERALITLQSTAIAGAILVGIAGSKWLTNEVDKKQLKESIVIAAEKKIPAKECKKIIKSKPQEILKKVEDSAYYEL